MRKPQAQDEDRIRELIARNKEAAKPVLADLLQAGLDVDWIEDLYNKRLDYKRVIPVLLHWLPRVDNPAIKEAIVRALSVPWAKHTEASKLLVEEFRRSKSDFGLNWAIGNALSVVADDEVLDDIVNLIGDKTYGKAREMLVVALANMKTLEVNHLLIELLNDEDLAGYAIMALGKLKSKEARPAIERFISHTNSWIRREAKKALVRIDKMGR